MNADPELRGLDRALDPDEMLPFVGQAAGLAPGEVAGFRCAPEVITHKRGQRCAIRYVLSTPREPEQRDVPGPVFGKVYRSRARATLIYERTEALRQAGVPSIPACLMLVPRMRLVLQECAEGCALGQLLGSADAQEPLALAARWLLDLHAARPLPGLREVPSSRSLQKAIEWGAEIATRLPSAARAAQRCCSGLERLAHALPACTYTMIHRDYHPAHVIWNGSRISIVDFDELSLGDPALDVGHFLAQLEYQAHCRTGRSRAFAAQATLFETAYRQGAPSDPGPRLPFARAYTFIKLAHQQARRQPPGWRQGVSALLALAVREVGPKRSTAR